MEVDTNNQRGEEQVAEEEETRRPRTASKSVKLQRPDSGRRVQSLLKGRDRRILPVPR
jgi:hypothetical protein